MLVTHGRQARKRHGARDSHACLSIPVSQSSLVGVLKPVNLAIDEKTIQRTAQSCIHRNELITSIERKLGWS